MTTPEDKLAALLREEADDVVPSGDGLAVIHKRLASRRRARWFLLPGAALVAGGAAAAVVVLSGSGGTTSLTQDPPASQPPSPVVTGTAAPTPTQSATGGGLDHAFENPSVWPFHSAQDIARWQTTFPYANDKVKLVQGYFTEVLAMRGLRYSLPCESCDVVEVRDGNGTKLATAALERYLLGGTQVYTISGISGGDLTITRPTVGEAISSPTTVTGRITGFDERVNVAVIADDGQTIATGGAQAGTPVPWTTRLTWSSTQWSYGGIVARTFSMKDGTLNRLTVVPVSRGQRAAPAFAPAIWPFASASQVAAWHQDSSRMPWASDPQAVANHFLTDYLSLRGITATPACASCLDLVLRNTSARTIGTLRLVPEEGAYSVAGVTLASGLSVTAPAEGQRLSSPTTVTGTVEGVDESIVMTLRAQSGKVLGSTSAPAGSGQPWSGRLSWSDRSWYTGALVLATYSPKDGALNRLVVIRVVNGP